MAVLVVAAIASASLARQLAGKVYVNDARHELPVAPQAATASARKAIAHNKYDPEAWYVLAAAYARRNDYVRARDALLAAAHMEPFNYVPWTLLGDLATRRGLRGEARRAYARAAQLNPHDAALIRR
jgi:cytochrome c-type biogenesis protein CcmH/NrfG